MRLYDHLAAPPEYTLRPYQKEAKDRALAMLRPGYAGLYVAPTGSGKTILGASIIKDSQRLGLLDPANPVALFIAHREELISQTYHKLLHGGVVSGVIRADDPRTNYARGVQVASLQTLVPRLNGKHNLKDLRIGLILVDEAHHAAPGSNYRAMTKCWPGAPVVGLTATPFRADDEPLGDWFNDLYVVTSPSKLLAEGYLVPPAMLSSGEAPDLSGVRRSGADYNTGELSQRMVVRALTGCMVSHWMEHGRGRPTLGFAVAIEDALAHVAAFKAAGISSALVDGSTPETLRIEALRRFEAGLIEVLWNVGVFTEGTDLPFVSCLIDARPTQSLGLYIQMMGRGLRPCPERGKVDCRILDHAGNYLRHGSVVDDREFALHSTRPEKQEGRGRKSGADGEESEPVRPGVACKASGCSRRILAHEFQWRSGAAHCPACGAPQSFEESIKRRAGKLRPVRAMPTQGEFL